MGAPCSSPLDNSLPLGTSPVGERRGRSDDMRNRWDEGSTEVSLPLAMLAITLASRCNRNPQPAPSSSAGRGRHLARDSASSGPAARRFRGGRVCVISSMTEAFLVVCSWPTTPEAKFVLVVGLQCIYSTVQNIPAIPSDWDIVWLARTCRAKLCIGASVPMELGQ